MDRSRRGGRQAAQLSPCAHGADEHPGIQGQIPHPHPVAQDGAAGKGTRGIHRDDANAQALGPPALGKGVGQRALARPWGTGDAKDAGPPGVGPELGEDGARRFPTLFDEADQAGHRAFITRPAPLQQCCKVIRHPWHHSDPAGTSPSPQWVCQA